MNANTQKYVRTIALVLIAAGSISLTDTAIPYRGYVALVLYVISVAGYFLAHEADPTNPALPTVTGVDIATAVVKSLKELKVLPTETTTPPANPIDQAQLAADLANVGEQFMKSLENVKSKYSNQGSIVSPIV